MKTLAEMRLECIRMAASMAASKTIAPRDVVPTAMEFYRWVDEGSEGKADVGALIAKFGKGN